MSELLEFLKISGLIIGFFVVMPLLIFLAMKHKNNEKTN
jgi:hypothetical protein